MSLLGFVLLTIQVHIRYIKYTIRISTCEFFDDFNGEINIVSIELEFFGAEKLNF
jgi:hypothetical protein